MHPFGQNRGGGGLWTNGRVPVNATRLDTPNAPFLAQPGGGGALDEWSRSSQRDATHPFSA